MTDPTPTPLALDLAALRKFAIAATPGPWMAKQGAISPGKKVIGPREASDLARGPIVLMQPIFWDKRSAANADHIAAFDPPTALALIARAEAAEAKVAAVRELAQRLREHPGGSGEHEAADAIDGALTGHWKTLGGTPTGDFADVCACGKSYWPCDSLDGTA